MSLPNVLSALRVFLSLCLLLLWRHTALFVIVYLVCGLTDVADGYLARKLHAVSRLGAFLDSLADLVFVAAVCFLAGYRFGAGLSTVLLIGLTVVALTRLFNLALTRLRFRRWAIMHTVLNKACGLVLFLAILVLVVRRGLFAGFVTAALGLALVSALEETLILLSCKDYEVDRLGLLRSHRQK